MELVWITFGVNEAYYENYINQGVTAYPEVHDAGSPTKIECYARRVHFHATGIALS